MMVEEDEEGGIKINSKRREEDVEVLEAEVGVEVVVADGEDEVGVDGGSVLIASLLSRSRLIGIWYMNWI